MSSSEKYRRILEDVAEQEEVREATAGRSFLERQLEWLMLGLTVVLLGLAWLSQSEIVLRVIFPLVAGGIMMLSAIIQKIGRNWRVSIFTWVLSVLLLAFGITEFLSRLPTQESFSYLIYFSGSVIVLGGVVILLQVLRRG